MNNRIKRLADRAGINYATGFGYSNDKVSDLQLEEFAELIVRECANLCLSGKNKENWRCTDSINKGFSDAVLDYFGVDE